MEGCLGAIQHSALHQLVVGELRLPDEAGSQHALDLETRDEIDDRELTPPVVLLASLEDRQDRGDFVVHALMIGVSDDAL